MIDIQNILHNLNPQLGGLFPLNTGTSFGGGYPGMPGYSQGSPYTQTRLPGGDPRRIPGDPSVYTPGDTQVRRVASTPTRTTGNPAGVVNPGNRGMGPYPDSRPSPGAPAGTVSPGNRNPRATGGPPIPGARPPGDFAPNLPRQRRPTNPYMGGEPIPNPRLTPPPVDPNNPPVTPNDPSNPQPDFSALMNLLAMLFGGMNQGQPPFQQAF